MDDSKTPSDPTPEPPAMPLSEPIPPVEQITELPAKSLPARTEAEAAEPLSQEEIRASFTRPHRMLDVVLGERFRLSANVRTATNLRGLVAALLVCSTLFSLPFALVDGPSRVLHVALLFLGSVLLCFPSFLVFASYLGVRLHAAQS